MVSIYALVDPRNLRVMYVGQTVDIKSRMVFHSSANDNATMGWVSELRACEMRPSVIILQESEDSMANDDEAAWIQMFSARGKLLNKVYNSETCPFIRHEIWTDAELSKRLEDAAKSVGLRCSELVRISFEVGVKSTLCGDASATNKVAGARLGSVGGKASAARMTPEQRSERARVAGRARWSKRNLEKLT